MKLSGLKSEAKRPQQPQTGDNLRLDTANILSKKRNSFPRSKINRIDCLRFTFKSFFCFWFEFSFYLDWWDWKLGKKDLFKKNGASRIFFWIGIKLLTFFSKQWQIFIFRSIFAWKPGMVQDVKPTSEDWLAVKFWVLCWSTWAVSLYQSSASMSQQCSLQSSIEVVSCNNRHWLRAVGACIF